MDKYIAIELLNKLKGIIENINRCYPGEREKLDLNNAEEILNMLDQFIYNSSN